MKILIWPLLLTATYALSFEFKVEGKNQYSIKNDQYEISITGSPLKITTYNNNGEEVLTSEKATLFIDRKKRSRQVRDYLNTIESVASNGTMVEFHTTSKKTKSKINVQITPSESEYNISIKAEGVSKIGFQYKLSTSGNWFGEGELAPRAALLPVVRGSKEQFWPLNRGSYKRKRFMLDDNNAVLVPIWFTQKGAAIFADTYDFLSEEFNLKKNDKIVIAKLFNEKRVEDRTGFNYNVIVKKNIKELYQYWIAKGYQNKKPWNPKRPIPHMEMFDAPVWQTWAQFKSKYNGQMLMDYAKKIKASGLPYKLLGMDDRWQSQYGDFAFDLQKFPQPKKMIKKLNKMGFDVSLWTLNFVHKDAKIFPFLADLDGSRGENWLIRENSDKPNGLNGTKLIRWWDTSYIKKTSGVWDITNPKMVDWLEKTAVDFKKEYGIVGYKYDAGEARYVTLDFRSKNDIHPNRYADLYVSLMDRLQGTEYRTGRFVQQYFPIMRQYDKNSSWDNVGGLKAVVTQTLSLGMIGYPLVLPGVVGGDLYFANDKSSELYIRWVQMNTFLPLMQLSVPPWERGEEAFEQTKIYLDYFQKLNQYKMRFVNEAKKDGTPIVRPMFYEFPEDQDLYDLDEQFMYGDSILVAPVLHKGDVKKDVYLPKGEWIDVFSKEKFSGPKWLRNYDAPIEKIPVFVKAESEELADIFN